MSVSVDLIMLGKLVLILGGFRQAFILFFDVTGRIRPVLKT
jgi:hypothetical protein